MERSKRRDGRRKADVLKALVDVTKPKQTFLLMVTFSIAFIVASREAFDLHETASRFATSFISVFLAVSGTTALNMWLDRDIDALMMRTRARPLPAGILKPAESALFGSMLFILSSLLALQIGMQFLAVIVLGLFFDIIIYTILLKRRSPYSIVLGGFAGAMPALAGWVAASHISLEAFLLAGIVLLWIPSHIWYISMHYEDDYRKAGIPMYPLVVGMEKASWAIVIATSIMLVFVTALLILMPLSPFYPLISIPATIAFLFKTVRFAMNPNREKAKKMYKLASMTLGLIYLSMLVGALT